MAIRGIDSNIKWGDTFHNNQHKDLRADFIIANPPFNVSDWSGDLLRKDGRWQYGTPPTGNANYAWIQHFIYHLAPTGQAGFVLAKGSLTSKSSGEGDIRKNLIEERLVDCIVNLPAKLFLNTQIPASLWFMSRNRTNGKYRDRIPHFMGHVRQNQGGINRIIQRVDSILLRGHQPAAIQHDGNHIIGFHLELFANQFMVPGGCFPVDAPRVVIFLVLP